MSHLSRWFSVILVCLSCVTGTRPAAAQFLPYVNLPIALEGDTAPGTGGAVFASFGPSLGNFANDVAFVANLSGGATSSGLFIGSLSGPGRAVALAGDPVDGTTLPGTPTFSEFTNLSIRSTRDDVAFRATLDGTIAGASGIFVELDGVLAPVAVTGDDEPNGMGSFVDFGAPILSYGTPVLAAPSVLFAADMTGDGSFDGIYRYQSIDQSLTRLAFFTDVAPGMTNAVYFGFGDPTPADSDIVFEATVFVDGSMLSGIFRQDENGMGDLIALEGDLAPDGVPYAAFLLDRPAALLPVVAYSDGHAVYMLGPEPGDPGGPVTPHTLARVGDTFPSHGSVAGFPSSPRLGWNDTGPSIVVTIDFTGGPTSSGIAIGDAGGLGVLLATGDPAPGTNGGTYQSFPFRPSYFQVCAEADPPSICLITLTDIVYTAPIQGGSAAGGVFLLPEPHPAITLIAGAVLLLPLSIRRSRRS